MLVETIGSIDVDAMKNFTRVCYAGLAKGGYFITGNVNYDIDALAIPWKELRVAKSDVINHGSMLDCLLPHLAGTTGQGFCCEHLHF